MGGSMKDIDTLRKASEHIYYEWRMLNETSLFWADAPEGYAKSALLESFLIHCRNLIYFLFASRKIKEDLLASDYLETWNSEMPQLLKDWKEKIHKYVAHLSFDRNKGIVYWPVMELRQEINHLMHDFVKTTRDDLIDSPLKNYSPKAQFGASTGFTTSLPNPTIIKNNS